MDILGKYKIIAAITGNDSVPYTGCVSGFIDPTYNGNVFLSKIFSNLNEINNLQIHTINLQFVGSSSVKIVSCFWINLNTNKITDSTLWRLYGAR